LLILGVYFDVKAQNQNAEDRPHPQGQALDELLGRASLPFLEAGFANRVLQTIACEDSSGLMQNSQSERTSAERGGPIAFWATRIALVAALFVTCAGLLLFNLPQPGTQANSEVLATHTPLDEAVLIQTLQSNALTSDDLALVSKLGEVLEAELSAHNSLWPDYE
jgi:hypothetical protein